jgi:hypothetical protein
MHKVLLTNEYKTLFITKVQMPLEGFAKVQN